VWWQFFWGGKSFPYVFNNKRSSS